LRSQQALEKRNPFRLQGRNDSKIDRLCWPFEKNLVKEKKSDAYFATVSLGRQILTRLSKIADLKGSFSRQSTERFYKTAPGKIWPEIGLQNLASAPSGKGKRADAKVRPCNVTRAADSSGH